MATCPNCGRETCPTIGSPFVTVEGEQRSQLDCVRAARQAADARAEKAERERDEAIEQYGPFAARAAAALADEVAVLIRRRVIDSRSPAGDALLDFREPPTTARADRMAEMESERDAALQRATAAEAQIDEWQAMHRAVVAQRDDAEARADALAGALEKADSALRKAATFVFFALTKQPVSEGGLEFARETEPIVDDAQEAIKEALAAHRRGA